MNRFQSALINILNKIWIYDVKYRIRVTVMMINATFNNISVILAEETGSSRENHRPAASHWQTLSHNVVSSGIQTHNVSGDTHWLHR